MKIAVLSDIHGNILALDAVLADLDRHRPDHVVDLGDCVSGPLWPRETLERLDALGALTIRGNHERQLATLPADEMGPSDRFAYDSLNGEQIGRLGSLPGTAWVTPEILACHGTPQDDNTFLIDAVEGGRLVRGHVPAIAAHLGNVTARMVLCGHSHRPDLVRPSTCRRIRPSCRNPARRTPATSCSTCGRTARSTRNSSPSRTTTKRPLPARMRTAARTGPSA